MSQPVIQARNVGKKYLLRHLQTGRNYRALRDVIAGKARSLVKFGNIARPPATEEFWALQDVSFSVNQGDAVGIIGRNGAGKSTLLKLLSRITEPTTGSIRLRGRVASLLEVGTGFHPELTGRENIFLNGAILGMSRIEIKRKFDEIVAFAEVEKFLDTPVKHYSSGMYVRLAFAVAAHLEPEILIVDEVLAVGDAEFQKKCLGKMQDVSTSEGRTVLFVSHNLNAVRTLCRSGILLARGQIVHAGEISTVLDAYSRQVASQNEVTYPYKGNKPTITRITVHESALAEGNLIIDVAYETPVPLQPVVPGILLSSLQGTPVYGSNPRFHNLGYTSTNALSGAIRMTVNQLPVYSSVYKLSVWLGDAHRDYDAQLDALSFEFHPHHLPPNLPSLEYAGYLDFPATWRQVA
jgi:lipopolysaccharide transport system ATP-binding protein